MAAENQEEESLDGSWPGHSPVPKEREELSMKINVIEIQRGQLIAVIRAPTDFLKASMRTISYIYYDERQHEVYTGHQDGSIHLWY